jgi:hypothetical protein
MKKLMIIAALGFIGYGANAQTNRTYRTDMSNERIYNEPNRVSDMNTNVNVKLNSGTNNQETQPESSLKMSNTQQFQGYSSNTLNGTSGSAALRSNNRTANNIESVDLPYRSIPYDTTKNNGHCIGCGSGTLTDPHFDR